MLGKASVSELLLSRKARAVSTGNVMWIWIQSLFNENDMKISNEKSTFDIPWYSLKLSEYQLSLLNN